MRGSRTTQIGLYLLVLLLGPMLHGARATSQEIPEELRTVAERSGYKATATHEQVIALCNALATRSDRIVRAKLGLTVESREIPLLIVADPPIASPQEAQESGKLVSLAYVNIHAGEVCGKEALLMLAREAALAGETPEWLQDTVVLLVPIYNADGNERFATTNRPGQRGPEAGMGQRPNAQGLDLNRDWVKMEAPETRAMVRALIEWDPDVVIDTHTTNGSRHRYTMTYAGPKHPAGDPEMLRYVRETFLPEVGRRVEASTGYRSFPYGNFTRDRSAWTTYPPLPRYSTNYQGVRGHLSILTEAYAYATYRDRVLSTLAFVRESLQFASENRERVRGLREAFANSSDSSAEQHVVPLRTEARRLEEIVKVLGYKETDADGDGRPETTDEPATYSLQIIDDHVPTLSITRPRGYILPEEARGAVETLMRHGISVRVLREDRLLDIEVSMIGSIQRSNREFQGHRLVDLSNVSTAAESRMIRAGSYLVEVNGPLANLTCLLLEAQSPDGLAAWNVFDDALKVGDEYPVLRWVGDRQRLATFEPTPLPEDRPEPQPLTYAMYNSGRRPRLGSSPASVTWIDEDSIRQRRGSELFRIDARTGDGTPIESEDRSKMAEALATLDGINATRARLLVRQPGLELDPSEEAALFSVGDDLYYARLDGSEARRLTDTPEEETLQRFSPTGSHVAYVRENDLYTVDVSSGVETKLTTDGSSTILNGTASYIYYEEIFNRSRKSFWWSPDGTKIAFLRFDDSKMEVLTIPEMLGFRQEADTSSYPKPGDANPDVRLGIVDIRDGSLTFADLDDDGQRTLIVSAGWFPNSETAYGYVQDRIQTWLDVVTVDPADGSTKVLFRETTGAWVDVPEPLRFLDDGTFLFRSERSGWAHWYRYRTDGSLINAVTNGSWEVRRVHRIDGENGTMYVSGTRDNPIANNLYRVPLDGGDPVRLTSGPSSHQVSLSPGGSLFLDRSSDPATPTRITLHNLEDGALLRTIDSNPFTNAERYLLSSLERVQISMPDGFVLEGEIILPPDLDPSRKYAVWLTTYGGPHAPTVRDSWTGGRLRDRMYADELDLIVFRVDPRSASGKGAVSTWAAYRQLGVSELADIESALRWLIAERPYVDAERIGISGYSYGGFMTAYAMTHSTMFAAGIAGAPVTDWRDYDSIYTERYMSTPEDNPDGYRKTSAVEAAANLQGRLLIAHGLRDDNVAIQNTFKFVRALQQADKDFELMIYPEARHGIRSGHFTRLQFEFMRRTLGGSRERSGSSATASVSH